MLKDCGYTLADIAQIIKTEIIHRTENPVLMRGDVAKYIRENQIYEKYEFTQDDKYLLESELEDVAYFFPEETAKKIIAEICDKIGCSNSDVLYIQKRNSKKWAMYINPKYYSRWLDIEIDFPYGLEINFPANIVFWLYNIPELRKTIYFRILKYIHTKYSDIYNWSNCLSYNIDIDWLDGYGVMYARHNTKLNKEDFETFQKIINEETEKFWRDVRDDGFTSKESFFRFEDEMEEEKRLRYDEWIQKISAEIEESEKEEREKQEIAELYIEPEKDLLTDSDRKEYLGSYYKRFPGIMGWIYGYLMDNAFIPNSEYAQATVIALMSLLVNHGYHARGINGREVAANLYVVVSGESGSGKDFGRQFIKNLLAILGHSEYFNEMYKSAPAIENDLRGWEGDTQFRPRIWLCDEMGQFLEVAKSKGTNQYTKEIPNLLLKLYTSAIGEYKPAIGATDQGLNKWRKEPIRNPFFVLYGTSTPQVLNRSFSSDEINTGLIGRLMIFTSGKKEAPEYTPINWDTGTGCEIPDSILSESNYILNGGADNPPTGILGRDFAKQKIVEIDDDGRRAFEAFKKWLFDIETNNKSEYRPPLLRRSLETSIKLSILWAVALNPDNPIIDGYCAYWGVFYAKKALNTVCEIVENYVADTETEAIYKGFIQFLKDNGGRVTFTFANNKYIKKFNDIEKKTLKTNIQESVEVTVEQVKAADGKCTNFYVLTGEKID